MKEQILKFILNSIEENPNNFDLGEEVRQTYDSLWKLPFSPYCPYVDHLRTIIRLYPNDADLGFHTRLMYKLLKNEIYVK